MEPRPSPPKNVHPCTFLGCKFAQQTCYCLEPAASVPLLIRRGLFTAAAWTPLVLHRSDVSVEPKLVAKSVQGCTLLALRQRRCAVSPFRKPFEIDGADTRREHKLTAGMVRNVLPCTFLTCEICISQISFLHRITAVPGGIDTLRINLCAAMKEMHRLFQKVSLMAPKASIAASISSVVLNVEKLKRTMPWASVLYAW